MLLDNKVADFTGTDVPAHDSSGQDAHHSALGSLNNELLSFLSWNHPGDTTLVLYGSCRWSLACWPSRSCVCGCRALGARSGSVDACGVLIVGVISTITFRSEWGTFRALPLVHDEAAYILQARLFAAGKWADSAPIPEFFEQPHVLVTPRLAEKYTPGNALLLTPGIWFDRPGLMPSSCSD